MDKTIELVNSVKDIQAMPSVIVKALNVMKDPNAGMKELGDIVIFDPSLSVKFLALVNSAYYGFSQQISSINIALSLLGMTKVKNIIITVAMKPMMSNVGDKEIWRHAIKVAAGCEHLAKMGNVAKADEIFIAGFMHDIGKLVLNASDPQLYEKVALDVANGINILDAEKKHFDTDHTKTGALIAKRWQLPVFLTNIIKYHHNPKLSTMPAICNIVYNVDLMVRDDFKPDLLDKEFIQGLNMDETGLYELREEILKKANIMISELS